MRTEKEILASFFKKEKVNKEQFFQVKKMNIIALAMKEHYEELRKKVDNYIEVNELVINQVCEEIKDLQNPPPPSFEQDKQIGFKQRMSSSEGVRWTNLELDILELLSSGQFTHEEIAKKLDISTKTVQRAKRKRSEQK